MAARDVRKNFNLFVDGKGFAGQIEEFTPPKLTLKTEEFRAAGMDAPIELTMGLEARSLIQPDRRGPRRAGRVRRGRGQGGAVRGP